MFEPLPPMPGLPDPTAVFITHEDTARALAESALAWVRRHSRRRRRNALRWVITAIVLYSLWSLGGLLIGLATCAALVGMYRRRWNSDPARTVALFSAMAAPGTVMATRFGPAAFDIQVGADTHRRIRYDSIRDLEVTPAAVAFGEGPQYHTSRRTRIRYEWINAVRIEDGVVELRGLDDGAYPRELFPDFAIAYIRALNADMAASR
ncbi:hypothetical protein ACFV4K_18895 [Nocardia sp. NPDC059764]|uniref:hypothetical protein n=1 Tax=Nocardia sp. NPDC059764 TaxID=3346939 RepID=UPI0036610BB6